MASRLKAYDDELKQQLKQRYLLCSNSRQEMASRLRTYDLELEQQEAVAFDLLLQQLRGRGLPCSGTKEQMASQLRTYDLEHPFNFFKLPAEIRNKIYELVAGYVLKPNDAGAKPAMKRNVSRLDGNPDLMALQPGLFRACQQTRAEGLAIFYQYRCFSFGTYLTGEFNIGVTLTKKNYNTLLNWLQRTGEFGRENIRGLVLAGKFDPADWSSIRLIHERLSDKATVVYEPMARHDASVLWAIGAMCESRYIGQAPTFRFFDQTYTTYNSDDEPSFNGGLGVSLSFSPGMSWFGGGQEASGQTTGSERHDVTAAENVKRFCAALSERSKDGFVRTLAR